MSKLTTITEATLLPISLVIAMLGGAAWLTKMYSIAADNKLQIAAIYEDLDEVEASRNFRRSQLWDRINDQDKRLARIEGKIDILLKIETNRGKAP